MPRLPCRVPTHCRVTSCSGWSPGRHFRMLVKYSDIPSHQAPSLVTSLAPATNNTNAEIPPAPPPGCRAHCGHSYFHQNYSGPGPSMSTVHCPRQRSQHCVDICVPSFSPDNVNSKYRADIQLEMWIYWSSSVCCGCCGNLSFSSSTAGEGRAQAPVGVVASPRITEHSN